jgi:signal transduction protein with GAF and PtsI domain
MEKAESKYYHSLYQVAAAINSARASEPVLNSIVENVAKAMGAKACSLTLLTRDRKLLWGRCRLIRVLPEHWTVSR